MLALTHICIDMLLLTHVDMQEHKAKHDRLLAHLAASAGIRQPFTRSPNYVSAGKQSACKSLQSSCEVCCSMGCSVASRQSD